MVEQLAVPAQRLSPSGARVAPAGGALHDDAPLSSEHPAGDKTTTTKAHSKSVHRESSSA